VGIGIGFVLIVDIGRGRCGEREVGGWRRNVGGWRRR